MKKLCPEINLVRNVQDPTEKIRDIKEDTNKCRDTTQPRI